MRRSSTLRAFLASRPGDKARVVLSGILLASVSVGFVVGSFSRLRRLLLWLCDTVSPVVPGAPAPERIVSAVEAADQHLPGQRTCLMRSLTAEALLRLYAFMPDHRIGVTKAPTDTMKAHSWLELRNNVVIGDLEDLSQYEPLPSLEMRDEL